MNYQSIQSNSTDPNLATGIVTNFLSLSYTKTEAIRRLRILKDFLNFYFFENSDQTDIMKSISSYENKQINSTNENLASDITFFKRLGLEFFQEFNHQNLNDNLKTLEMTITTTKIPIIYLATELPVSEIEKLGQWFKNNLDATAIFEINFDPSLIGGCAISYNGVVKDYSLRELIKESQKEILTILLAFKK